MTVHISDKDGNTFTLFYQKESPFSNFFPCSITVNEDGKQLMFSSSEQYFMYVFNQFHFLIVGNKFYNIYIYTASLEFLFFSLICVKEMGELLCGT
uniref:NADAR domain-containing protein n=1 Tax=Parascaris univalens TaxID=6257 RepID=A0A915B8T6_PARUN